jgi:predicted TIM-barrel fold metal-dependent hydrolase
VAQRQPIVDSHHHLWDLAGGRYPWLAGRMHDRGWGDTSALQRNYLPADFLADAARQNLAKSVHLQANFDPGDPVGETRWLASLDADPAARGFPHAIVAYADLSSPEAAAVLDAHAGASAKLRGIRQVLNRHADPALNRATQDYLADQTWLENVGLLGRRGWSFDVQVYYQQMPAVAALARRYPDMQFILDHAGMPAERDAAGIAGWRKGMRLLAGCPNIALKLCGYGMVDNRWTVASIRPFVLEPIDWFGPRRCMFGSNFPVDRLMASYDRLWDAYREIAAGFSAAEQHDLFRAAAERVYRI